MYKSKTKVRYARKGKKFIQKQKGGMVKKMVDGKNSSSLISAGVSAVPYLIKSVGLLKSLINTEEKYIDVATNNSFGTSGIVTLLSACAQGNDDVERNGNKILMKDLLFRVNINGSSTPSATNVRFILFVDKEFDGAVPSVTQVLQTASHLSPINIDYTKRFVILSDKRYSFTNTGYLSTFVKIYKQLQFHAFYDGSTTATADCKENMICALFITDQNVNQPGYNFYSRIKFYDN